MPNRHFDLHTNDLDTAYVRTIHVTDNFDIGAVRVEYDGRTYHLVADADDRWQSGFDDGYASAALIDGCYHHANCSCFHDAPAAAVDDNHDATRRAAIDLPHDVLRAGHHATYAYITSIVRTELTAHVAALRAAAGANTPDDAVK